MITPKFYVWLKCAAIRAIKTVAQSMLATIGTTAAWGDINWALVFSTALVAGLLSILTSIVTGLPEVEQKEQLDNIRKSKELNGQDDNIQ